MYPVHTECMKARISKIIYRACTTLAIAVAVWGVYYSVYDTTRQSNFSSFNLLIYWSGCALTIWVFGILIRMATDTKEPDEKN